MAATDDNGNWIDPQGNPVPRKYVTPYDRRQDKTVTKITRQARKVSDQLAKLKEMIFTEVDAFLEESEAEFGVQARTKVGNKQLCDFSATSKVEIRINKVIDFDTRLYQAKELIDECILDWSDGANDKLLVVVKDAFRVDEKGKLDRDRILGLRRLNIKDAKWKTAMNLISESIKVVDTRSYVRIHVKDEKTGKWLTLPLDIAQV